MSRRLSSKDASEAVGAYLQRTRDSRSSLESPNSSLSPWYISDRYGVSLSTMTIRSPYQPHSVSGSMSGINYMTSVSSSIIPRTRTRLITASTSGGGQVIHGGGAGSAPYACRPLRVGTDTAITGSNEPLPSYVRVIPSHGHLVQSHSSSCSCGHAFIRHTTRVSVRVGSMASSPVIADRMRQASFGRRTTRRASLVTANLSVSTGQAAQTTSPSCATLADFKQLDVTPGALTSAQTDAARQVGVTPTASTSSHDDVGRALFKDWAHRKQEMFADIFKDKNDFFADLLRKRVDEEHQPIAPAQVALSADSSHSGLFMTTISEAGEKDGPDTSAENYTVHSATTPSSTTEKTAVEEKTPLQALTASTRLTSSEFYSYEFSKTHVTETPNDGVTKEIPQDKAASLDGKLQYKSFDFQLKEVVMAPDAPDAETVKGTSVDLSTTETKSEEKKGRLGETLPLEQFHSTKAMPVSSAENLEAASTRTQVPTEARGHSYVPALAESSFETPGATSEEHQLLPTSLEGPFMSMASDMTDFPALDLSKTQEPDVSTQPSSLQKPDHGEVQTQLAERPQTDQRAQIQATGSLLKLGASGVSCPTLEGQTPRPQHTTEAIGQKEIGEHTKECESREVISMPPYQRSELALSEQTTTFDKGALEKQSNNNLKDVAQEHPSQGRPREESGARDFVPKEVDLSNEMAASVGSVTVSDAATAEKNKNLPLASHTEEPTNQEYPTKEEHDKQASNILAGLPELDSELISSEHAPLSDASMTLHTDDILTSTQIGESSTDDNVAMRQTPKESGEIIPRREEQSSEQGQPEDSAVDDEKSTEKRGSIPFTEPALRPMKERYADKKTSDVFVGHPEQDSEQFFSKQAPLPDVRKAHHTPDILPSTQTGESGADEQVLKRERAKESEIEEIVAGHKERSSEPELPDSSAVVEALPTEMHGGIPFTEAAVETGKEHYVEKQEHDKQTLDILVRHPEQDSELISSKQAPLSDVSMAQHTTDILPSTQTSESGADEEVLKRERAKESGIEEIVPGHEKQSSQPELPKSSAVVETPPTEKHDGIPFTKPAVELMNEHYVAEPVLGKKTSDIFVGPQQQESEQISSEHAAVPGVSITRDTTAILASTQVGASADDENVLTRQAAEASKSKDIVPGQEYEGSEPALTKGPAILETKATARETGISFTEPSTEPTDDVIIRKQKPDKKIQCKMSSNLQQVGELFSTEPTPLSDVDLSATQQPYDSLIRQSASAASYESTSQHETAKISNLRDFIPRQDQEGEPASSESSAALELKATAKHEGIPFADLPTEPTDDDFIRRQRPEKGIQRDVSSSSYLQKGGELVSTEPTPLSEADLSTTQPTDDWLLHQSSAAAPDESTLLHETAKVRHLQDIVPRQKDQSSKFASLESSAEFEMKATAEQNVPLAELSTEPTDDGFMKKQKPEKESQRKVSSERRQGGELVSTAPTLFSDSEFGTAVKSDDSLLSQHAASAPDESTMLHETEKISNSRDVVPRQEDKGNEPASSESSAALELKAIAKHERIPFVELSTKPTGDDFMKKPKPEKESQPAVTSYPQGGVSLVSTKPTPPSATGVRTTQPPDDSLLPHSSASASDESITMLVVVNLSDLKDVGPGKEDQESEPAPSEISRVVERSATEKHEALLKHALSTSLEYAQHPDHKEKNVEDRAENVKTGVFPAAQSTALGLQVGPAGVKRTSKEKTNTGREVIPCATVANELTWSASLERPTEHPEGEPEPTEDATLATMPDIQQPKKDEIERTVSDLVVDTFDKERGPLLSVTKTEKHSCEITSERILKRYGDTKPTESVTGARESFVVKGTESQFFDASMRKSIMRNAPETARTEVEYTHWKFEPDVFLDDLMGKSAIEPTEPSQPCDFIARPFDIFDDAVAVAAISATEGVSWKHSLSEDAVIPVVSKLTKESVPYCHKIEIEDNDNAFDNTNGVDETPEKASSKSDGDPICSPNASLVATFSPLPEAEFGSPTNQNQCMCRPTSETENTGTKLLARTKESDFTIKTIGTSQRPFISAQSNSSVDEILRTLYKPPFHLNGSLFQKQLVNANASSASMEKYVFPNVMLSDNVCKSPFYSTNSASEQDSTKDKELCQEQVPEDSPFDVSSEAPVSKVQDDAASVRVTVRKVSVACVGKEDEQLSKPEDKTRKNDSHLVDAATYKELPKDEGVALNDADDFQGKALSRAQRNDLEPLSRPCDRQLAQEQNPCRALAAGYTPLFHTEDVQALSDKQAKLHSANNSLEKNCAPFETASPHLRKPPLGTPAAEPPTTGASINESPATSHGPFACQVLEVNALYYEYTAPLKAQQSRKSDAEPVSAILHGAQASSMSRQGCSTDTTILNTPSPYGTEKAKHEDTQRFEQVYNQQPTYSSAEGKQPSSAPREDLNGHAFAADLRSWFSSEDAAMTEYPIGVQTDPSDKDSPRFEVPPRSGYSDTEPEEKRELHAIYVPVAAPNKGSAGGNDVAAASSLQEMKEPHVVGSIQKHDGVKNTAECAETVIASGADQIAAMTSLSSIMHFAQQQKSSLAVAAGTDGAGKPRTQKRRLSFSDIVPATSDANFHEKQMPLIGYSNVALKADLLPSDTNLRPSGKQVTYTIPEEEYSAERCERSTAVKSDAWTKAGEGGFRRPHSARQSVTYDELDYDEQSSGSMARCGELFSSTFTQSAPNDITTATNATWSAENKDDGLQRPLYVEAAFEDAKRQVHKPLLSLGTGRTDYSDEHITSTCDDETAPVDRLENAKGAGNSALESSIREFETSVLAGAASSGSLRKGGVPSTEQKTWLSSVSVGYTQEPRASDNTSSSGGDGSDDFERLKVHLFERTLSEGPGDIADEDLRKSELASSLSPSHVACTDTPLTREHAWSFDSEVGYAPATVLRDDVYRMSLPSSAAAEGPANEGSKIGVPASDKETTKSVNTLSPACESTLIAKEYAKRHSEEPQNENYDAQATSVPLERSRSERTESPAKHNGEKRMEPLSKPAGADSEDDGRDISGQSPDADDENREVVSRYKELRFENFRRIVKCMADLSSRSEVNIVYESFVTPVGKVCDTLGSVHYDTAFKVCVVDDYDLASIMHDRWNEDAASVAPTIKTFWSYSPHSFLMSVDENGTQCGIISAIAFEDEQAFCSANSVKREFLAEGAKRQLWDALLSVEHGKNLFTVVPANEVGAYYRHLGFYTSARGLILHGRLASDTELAPLGQVPLPDGVEIVKFKKQMYSSLLSFDKSTLGFGRKRFWRMTLREGPISFRVALQGGSVCGYAGLQNDVNGVPVVRWVVAADGQVAIRLLHNLLAGSFTFRQRGAWMALYARSHASAALLRHLDTSGFEPWMLLFNRREPFLQYKNIAVLTYI